MHWQIHKTGAAHHAEYEKSGERMPVCVAIGGPPVLTYAATAPLPPDIDEALFRGVPDRRARADDQGGDL